MTAQKEGVDANSTFGQPDFVDGVSGNYRVNESSPALKLGFKNFAMDNFGVTSAALKAIAQRVEIPPIIVDMKEVNNEKYDFLGAIVKNLNTLGERSATGMASETGVLILTVPETSILYGKLAPNDVILNLNGTAVKNTKDLFKAKTGLQSSLSTAIEVFRNQQTKKMEIRLK